MPDSASKLATGELRKAPVAIRIALFCIGFIESNNVLHADE